MTDVPTGMDQPPPALRCASGYVLKAEPPHSLTWISTTSRGPPVPVTAPKTVADCAQATTVGRAKIVTRAWEPDGRASVTAASAESEQQGQRQSSHQSGKQVGDVYRSDFPDWSTSARTSGFPDCARSRERQPP